MRDTEPSNAARLSLSTTAPSSYPASLLYKVAALASGMRAFATWSAPVTIDFMSETILGGQVVESVKKAAMVAPMDRRNVEKARGGSPSPYDGLDRLNRTSS